MQYEFRQGPSYGRTRDTRDDRVIGGFNPTHLSESRGFDGKRVRKAIQRRTIDYNALIVRHLQLRMVGTPPAMQPDSSFVVNHLPPFASSTVDAIATKFVHTSTNKVC